MSPLAYITVNFHSHPVVHGNLSGSNVLIREDGVVCIAGFGLSILLTEHGSAELPAESGGTLRWAAPERIGLAVLEDGIEGKTRLMPQSDVYSFGSIMLQILSGKVPYNYYARDVQVVLALSKGITPERPDSALVTERRWMFIQRCWSTVDVAQSRPSSGEIVQFMEEELAGARHSQIV